MRISMFLSVIITSACSSSTGLAGLGSYDRGLDLDPPPLDRFALVVRPDTATIDFAVETDTLDGVKAAFADVGKRLRAATPGASLVVRNLDPVREVSKRRSKDGPIRWRAEGYVRWSLSADDDAWSRAAVVNRLVQLRRQLLDGFATMDNPPTVTIGLPVASVAEPGRYRAQLLQRWMEKVEALRLAAGASLPVSGCPTVGEIEQELRTSEEIELRLVLACQLGVVRSVEVP